jgi:hypothetical protein
MCEQKILRHFTARVCFMSDPGQGGDRNDPSKPDSASPDTGAVDDQRSGRIVYDERGNAVWEWKLETGVYSRDINTQRLKKLELNELSIADTAKHQRPPEPMPGGGFNPYDNSSTAGGNVGSNPYNSAGSAALKPEPKPEEPRQRKPLDMRKLQEWIEIRKRVQENRREEGEDE